MNRLKSLQPIIIDEVVVDPPVVLAPMEEVTNQPFRRLAKRIGRPGLMVTEFVSAMALHYGAAKSIQKLRIHPEERPIGVQIFGGDPAVMAETARIVEEAGADLVDINMGCWVPKVCRTGSGAALLKDAATAERIVAEVVKATRIPVTVKVRAGWNYSEFAAPDLARRFEAAGARMLTLHARFARQGFEGEADWDLIRRLREAIQIPLVGNGDIKSGSDALRMFAETGCDGVMVGRAAISNPWRLAEIVAAAEGRQAPRPPTLRERIEVALQHLRWLIAFEAGVTEWDDLEGVPRPVIEDAERRACRRLRGQIPLYIKGYPGASQVRARLTSCSTLDEFRDVLETFATGRPDPSPGNGAAV